MRLLLGLLTLLMLSGTARAELASAPVGIPEATVRLIAGHVPGRGDMLGLHFRMQPKWKIYWRSPGDAGFPPVPDWNGSQGVRNLAIEWPLPERFRFYGLETYGYGDEVVLPVRMDRTASSGRVQLDLFYAACADICVPVTADLSLELPATSLPPEPRIETALTRVPRGTPSGLALKAVLLKAGPGLGISFAPGAPMPSADMIVEGPEGYVFETRTCAPTEDGTRCKVAILDQPSTTSLIGQALTITAWNADYMAEAHATVIAEQE